MAAEAAFQIEPRALFEFAPAKVNLALRVGAAGSDGYHPLESLVVFARLRDGVVLEPDREPELRVRGRAAAATGEPRDNLVLKAARELASRVPEIRSGRFTLLKRIPLAAGLGGGSADAAAALRLLCRANGLELDDPRVTEAAAATGADVSVCLASRARLMRGRGERLSDAGGLPQMWAVLVNPNVAVPTASVFAAFDRMPMPALAPDAAIGRPTGKTQAPLSFPSLIERLAASANDLAPAAISLAPAIADVLAALRELPGCRLARMSGSGATCFGLFETPEQAGAALRRLRDSHPRWWACATMLG
jgi:4-diphosphocytidyl-2-C-methyl-D-erythritol kinase